MLRGPVGDEEPDHRQGQDECQNTHGVKLPAPADRHDKAGDDVAHQHGPDHGANPPEGRGASTLLEGKPVGDEREGKRIKRGFTCTQDNARQEKLIVIGRDT